MDDYKDIISMPHHRPQTRAPMPNLERAAQFAPFAALTGYDDVIAETARLTDGEMFLDVGAEAELDGKLREIREQLHQHPRVTVTYFRPDSRKQGGAYVTVSGRVKKIDEYAQTLVLTDNTAIDLQKICKIE